MNDELTRSDIQKMQEEIDYRVQQLRPKLIEDVQYDYYNPAKVWAKTREAIGIMNPSI